MHRRIAIIIVALLVVVAVAAFFTVRFSGSQSGESETTAGRQAAVIDSIEVTVAEQRPLAVRAVVTAGVPDTCTTLVEVVQRRVGTVYVLSAYTERLDAERCVAGTLVSKKELELDVSGLEPGSYSVESGSARATFSLQEEIFVRQIDSSLPPQIAVLCGSGKPRRLTAPDGYESIIRGIPASVQACANASMWRVIANSDAGETIYYFDVAGVLVDICHQSEHASACVAYQQIACDDKNYCL